MMILRPPAVKGAKLVVLLSGPGAAQMQLVLLQLEVYQIAMSPPLKSSISKVSDSIASSSCARPWMSFMMIPFSLAAFADGGRGMMIQRPPAVTGAELVVLLSGAGVAQAQVELVLLQLEV
jgi:hypothetical protein